MATPKRRERTLRIERSALELFSRQGYETTTVAEIARHAGVSRRTVFRHFGRKRELVFFEFERNLGRLLEALSRQPVDAPPSAALHAAITELLDDNADDVSLLRMRAVRNDPTLRVWGLEMRAKWADAAAEALAARDGLGFPEARLVAGLLLVVWSESMVEWAQQRPDGPLADDFAARLERAANALSVAQPLSGRSG